MNLISALSALALFAASTPVAAAELDGLWRIKGSEVDLRFAPCGPVLCGLIENTHRLKINPEERDIKNPDPALKSRPLRGLPMLNGLTPAGGGWKGRVYNPGDGKTYGASLQLTNPSTLALKGCIAPLLCQSFTLDKLPG